MIMLAAPPLQSTSLHQVSLWIRRAAYSLPLLCLVSPYRPTQFVITGRISLTSRLPLSLSLNPCPSIRTPFQESQLFYNPQNTLAERTWKLCQQLLYSLPYDYINVRIQKNIDKVDLYAKWTRIQRVASLPFYLIYPIYISVYTTSL